MEFDGGEDHIRNLSEWGSFYWVVPVVILTFIVVWIVDKKRYRKPVLWTMLGIWFVALIYLMFLYRLPGRRAPVFNINAFHMYRDAARYSGPIAKNQALRQILFNMLLYVPFGLIVGALSRRVWLTILIGIGFSIITEALQYWTGLGWADIDDVISNIIGLLPGTLIYLQLQRWRIISNTNR